MIAFLIFVIVTLILLDRELSNEGGLASANWLRIKLIQYKDQIMINNISTTSQNQNDKEGEIVFCKYAHRKKDGKLIVAKHKKCLCFRVKK